MRFFEPTKLKVGLVAIGILLIGTAIALHLLHVNAIATCVLSGTGGWLAVSVFLTCIKCPAPKKDFIIELKELESFEESSDPEQESLSEEDEPASRQIEDSFVLVDG